MAGVDTLCVGSTAGQQPMSLEHDQDNGRWQREQNSNSGLITTHVGTTSSSQHMRMRFM